jgi:AraC family carnitine catabolism transcriptional activator
MDSENAPASHVIHFLILKGFSMLGLLAAVEPLRAANRFCPDLFTWQFVSVDGQPVIASNDMAFEVQASLADNIDVQTCIVCAGYHPEQYFEQRVFSWLCERSREGCVLGGIDTGSIFLAKAGLLRGYRATVHWEHLSAFREDFTDVHITGALYEIDRNRLTSSGGISSLDMMLQLISVQHGYSLAVKISEQFIHERIREPQDEQRMPISLRLQVHHPEVVRAVEIMEQNLQEPISVQTIAATVGLSSRQMARVFQENLGQRPSSLYLKLRLERARQLLRQTSMRILDIALACGFQSNAALSRAYSSVYGYPPLQERQRMHQE